MQSRFMDHLKVNSKAISAQAWTVQRAPGGSGNSRQSTHEGGKVVWIYLKVINKYQCSWLRMRIRFSWLWTVSSVQCHAMHPIPLLGVEAACCGKWLWCHNERNGPRVEWLQPSSLTAVPRPLTSCPRVSHSRTGAQGSLSIRLTAPHRWWRCIITVYCNWTAVI